MFQRKVLFPSSGLKCKPNKPEASNSACLAYSSTLKMEVHSSETSVNLYETRQRIPKQSMHHFSVILQTRVLYVVITSSFLLLQARPRLVTFDGYSFRLKTTEPLKKSRSDLIASPNGICISLYVSVAIFPIFCQNVTHRRPVLSLIVKSIRNKYCDINRCLSNKMCRN
jgi:hypothetical protein